MPIDKKYIFEGYNPCKVDSRITQDGGFIIKATDIAAIPIINLMLKIYKENGASKAQVGGVLNMKKRVQRYQRKHGTKVPDVNMCEMGVLTPRGR